MNTIINPVRHGLIMAVSALIFGALWAAYMATHHEQLHGAFEAQEEKVQQAQMKHLMNDLNIDAMQIDHKHPAGTSDDHHHAAAEDHHADV
ncbi:MAG: hypothetical protein R8K54_00740, partial [Mariprofundaceae bacterium]